MSTKNLGSSLRHAWMRASAPQVWDGTAELYAKSSGSWIKVGTQQGWTKSDCIVELWQITDWSTFGSVSEVRLENKTSNTTSPGEAVRAVEEKTDGSGSNRFSVWVIENKSVAAGSLTLLDPGASWSKEIWDIYQADPSNGAASIGRVYRSAKTTNNERATLDQWFYSSSYTGVSGSTKVWLKKNDTAAYTQADLDAYRDATQSTGNWTVHQPGYHFRRYT